MVKLTKPNRVPSRWHSLPEPLRTMVERFRTDRAINRRTKRRLLALVRNDSAAVLIEMAFALPILCCLFLGAIDVGFCQYSQARLGYVVEASAKCWASGAPCTDPGSTETYAQMRAIDGMIDAATFTAIDDSACGRRVTGSFAYSALGPYFPSMQLAATACYPVSS